MEGGAGEEDRAAAGALRRGGRGLFTGKLAGNGLNASRNEEFDGHAARATGATWPGRTGRGAHLSERRRERLGGGVRGNAAMEGSWLHIGLIGDSGPDESRQGVDLSGEAFGLAESVVVGSEMRLIELNEGLEGEEAFEEATLAAPGFHNRRQGAGAEATEGKIEIERTLSRGSDPAHYPAEPLASCPVIPIPPGVGHSPTDKLRHSGAWLYPTRACS